MFTVNVMAAEPEQRIEGGDEGPEIVGGEQAVIVFVATTVPLTLPVCADNVTLPVPDPIRVTVVGLPEEVTLNMLVLLTVQ